MHLSKIKYLFVVFCFSIVINAFAQDSLRTKFCNLNLELGGNGGLYSLNYEGKIYTRNSWRLVWMAGTSVVPVGGKRIVIDLPVSIGFIYGKKKHKFIFSTGQNLIVSTGGKGGTIRGNFRLGYRFENRPKRYYIQIAYTPNYSYLQNFQFENWAGFSVGYFLKKR